MFDAALPAAASPLLRLGVLLSAAAAGTGSTELGGGGEGVGGMYDPEPQVGAALLAGVGAVHATHVLCAPMRISVPSLLSYAQADSELSTQPASLPV